MRHAIGAGSPSDLVATLEQRLFGSADPDVIAHSIDEFCRAYLAVPVARLNWHRIGVAAVYAVELLDGRRVVVKVHRPDRGARLETIQQVQRHVARHGFPCPQPLVGPTALANGLATAESLLEAGRIIDAHHPTGRALLARGLHDLVEACAVLVDRVDPGGFWLAGAESLWPAPHDVRFDFEATASGAEWIDQLALSARRRLAHAPGRLVLGHLDWRVENLRVDAGRIVAIYDWESLSRLTEPVLVGAVAHAFTASWDPQAVFAIPSLEESRAFIEDYALARDAPFSAEEIGYIDSAHLYALAYGARCEHSDAVLRVFPNAVDDGGYRALLAERGEHWLTSTLRRQ